MVGQHRPRPVLQRGQARHIEPDQNHRGTTVINHIDAPGTIEHWIGFGPRVDDLRLPHGEIRIEVVSSKFQDRQRQVGYLEVRFAHHDDVLVAITIQVGHVQVDRPGHEVLVAKKMLPPEQRTGQTIGVIRIKSQGSPWGSSISMAP